MAQQTLPFKSRKKSAEAILTALNGDDDDGRSQRAGEGHESNWHAGQGRSGYYKLAHAMYWRRSDVSALWRKLKTVNGEGVVAEGLELDLLCRRCELYEVGNQPFIVSRIWPEFAMPGSQIRGAQSTRGPLIGLLSCPGTWPAWD